MSDAEEEVRRIGRDEMNLCELPITLLVDHVPPECKTIAFEDQHGRLIVSGSDVYGLPTALDSAVIVGLIQLTKLRNDFTDPMVRFSRYELLKLLGWPDQTRYYRRLNESLRRWVGVTLYYDGCWWDNERKRWVNANFHILECVILPDKDDPKVESSFTWNKVFFKSCRDGNLKKLDLHTYFSLKSAVSKQLYRFLDKKFYVRGDWTFDLRELAHDRIGLSRTYAPRNIKQKLQPALEELEGIGYLEAMTGADRYTKVGRGNWTIRLVRKLPAPTKPGPEPEPTGLEAELIGRGVTRSVAAELVTTYPEERIRRQIEVVDWRREKPPKKKIEDPAGYLVDAIRKDHAPPAGFESVAQRAEKEAAERSQQEQVRREHARQQEAETREAELREQVAAYWAGLSPDQQRQLEADALEWADPEARANCTTGPAQWRASCRRKLHEAYIRHLLQRPESG